MGQNLTLFVNHIYLLQFLVFSQQFESTHPTRKGHVIKILKLGRHKKYFCYITELFIYNWKSSTFVAQKEIFLLFSSAEHSISADGIAEPSRPPGGQAHGIWQTFPNFFVTNKLEADSKFFCHKQTRTRFQIFLSQTNWNPIPNFFITYKLDPDSKFFCHKQTRARFQIFSS